MLDFIEWMATNHPFQGMLMVAALVVLVFVLRGAHLAENRQHAYIGSLERQVAAKAPTPVCLIGVCRAPLRDGAEYCPRCGTHQVRHAKLRRELLSPTARGGVTDGTTHP
jgi:hypothetical protein